MICRSKVLGNAFSNELDLIFLHTSIAIVYSQLNDSVIAI